MERYTATPNECEFCRLDTLEPSESPYLWLCSRCRNWSRPPIRVDRSEADRFRRRREKLGITRRQLAGASGMPIQTIEAIEVGDAIVRSVWWSAANNAIYQVWRALQKHAARTGRAQHERD